jgi:hypothetical protein
MLRFGTAYQEIATSGFALLAMTVVVGGWDRLFFGFSAGK